LYLLNSNLALLNHFINFQLQKIIELHHLATDKKCN